MYLERYIFIEIAFPFFRIIRIVTEGILGNVHNLHSDTKLVRCPRGNADT